MIKIKPNIWIGYINGRVVKLVYRGDDKSDLYINGKFKGICSFSYTKNRVEELEGVKRLIDLYV
jgi:hypothetical protein